MPRGGKCNHPACLVYGEGCRMLTDEELTPTAEDRALAERLVAEDWIQVSAKYRTLLRWKEPPPKSGMMLTSEIIDGPWAKMALEILDRHFGGEMMMRMAPDHMVERIVLTVTEFKAWKHLKNKPWRDHLARVRAARSAIP